jgi:thymidylate synthase
MSTNTVLVETNSLGQCWLQISKLIIEQGRLSTYDGTRTREVANLTMVIEAPDPADPLILEHGDPTWLSWMHENFFVQKEVAELDNAASYAIRLFNYSNQGRDQIQWVIDRLRTDSTARSAAITTFMPLTDTTYIPCISLLDFWIPTGSVELVVYAHSLDFGKKAYGNLVELAHLQSIVAKELDRPIGKLIIHVKTAHIYQLEWDYMRQLYTAVSNQPVPLWRAASG